jgi:hypothetical protein
MGLRNNCLAEAKYFDPLPGCKHAVVFIKTTRFKNGANSTDFSSYARLTGKAAELARSVPPSNKIRILSTTVVQDEEGKFVFLIHDYEDVNASP